MCAILYLIVNTGAGLTSTTGEPQQRVPGQRRKKIKRKLKSMFGKGESADTTGTTALGTGEFM